MKHENILKNLEKQGYKIEPMEFSFQKCLGVNVDFELIDKSVRQVSGTKHSKEYTLTVDTAKNVCMMENTDAYGCTQKHLTDYLRL